VASVNAQLLARLKKQLGLSTSGVYARIEQKVRETKLPRHLAAIALASESGINIARYADAEDLAALRDAARSAAPAPVIVPASAPATKARRHSMRVPRAVQQRRGTSVFVIHGRNTRARDVLFAFLRALDLRPIEWVQAIRRTGQPSPYVGTILETAFRDAAAVVVLLTPDDEARLRAAYRKTGDAMYEKRLTGQARSNVLFEAGMAFGRDPNSTVLVQLGDVRPFSDVAGRHVVHLSNAPTTRQELATKLANAGCNVNTSGSDWLDASIIDFAAARLLPRKPRR
jgi:predicted nucleotide-binding protein